MLQNISQPHTTMALLSRLLREYVRPHKGKLLLAILCMVVAAATTALNAWMLQPVLDEIFFQHDAQMLLLLPLLIILVTLVSGAANYGHTLLMRALGQRIVATLQLKLFSHLMHADLSTFHDQGAGHLISRFTNDIQLMRAAVSNVLTGIAKEALTMLFLIGVMFYQSWQLSLIAFLLFPIAIHPVIRLGRRMRKISENTQAELGVFTAQLDETFQGVRMVKAYVREEHEIARAGNIIEKLYRLYFKSARVQAAAGPIMETLGGVLIAAVIWYGGSKVLSGHTTPGAFFSFIAAMIMAYRPAKVITTLNTNLQEGLAAAKRLFHVLDMEARVRNRPGAATLQIHEGAIRFDNVSFRYGEHGGGVSQISLEVPAGKTVALVGPSGGGKSTLMNLLLRFYDVDAGRIVIDGQDIRDVTMQSLRRSMALVSQETVLFDDTVRANIAYGRTQATQEEIVAAARGAAADAFIRELPQGYDTMIGPHGIKLSGGQRQRIAIARAMLKDAPILLLDEATSSLDSVSERSVQNALEVLMSDRTTLVIAHRLSTVMHADLIYVMIGGRIVESGTHDSLLAAQGEYCRLYAHQFTAGQEIFA